MPLEITMSSASTTSFSMRGGSLCLDFHNHLRPLAETSIAPEEAWERCLAWAVQAGVIDAAAGAALRGSTGEREIAALLRRLRRRWVALHRIFLDVAGGVAPDVTALDLFNVELSEALRHARIERGANGFVWSWDHAEQKPERLLWPVMRSAADLLTGGDLERLRVCDNAGCGWLFVDRSRNASRRWCDMQDCGNVAKVRRFRERQRSGRPPR